VATLTESDQIFVGAVCGVVVKMRNLKRYDRAGNGMWLTVVAPAPLATITGPD